MGGSAEDFPVVLAAAQSGGEWALAAIYRDLNPPLLRYLAVQAPGAGEDLASETWLGAARRLSAFRGDEKAFRAWLFTIAHHRVVQHWRQANRRASVSVDPIGMAEYPASDDPKGEVVDAAIGVAAARRITEVLSPAQAEVVLLRVLGGLDVDQVATVLNKRPGAVRVLQHKALRNLAGRNFSLEGVTPCCPGTIASPRCAQFPSTTPPRTGCYQE
jgi:RNA polymerase sigma-70 factor (ECF subfamily)